ncbi:hypothetical protein D3C71_1720010 [compost metagenome]
MPRMEDVAIDVGHHAERPDPLHFKVPMLVTCSLGLAVPLFLPEARQRAQVALDALPDGLGHLGIGFRVREVDELAEAEMIPDFGDVEVYVARVPEPHEGPDDGGEHSHRPAPPHRSVAARVVHRFHEHLGDCVGCHRLEGIDGV